MTEIIIEGLTQNNLQKVSLRIPKEKITVFTGVSGSGKSSIVFDTIAAEAQRQRNATYPAVSASGSSWPGIWAKRRHHRDG